MNDWVTASSAASKVSGYFSFRRRRDIELGEDGKTQAPPKIISKTLILFGNHTPANSAQ